MIFECFAEEHDEKLNYQLLHKLSTVDRNYPECRRNNNNIKRTTVFLVTERRQRVSRPHAAFDPITTILFLLQEYRHR